MSKHRSDRKPLESHRLIVKQISENVGNTGGGKKLSEAMKEAGYSESYIKSGHIKDTQSWQNMLEDALPDDMLLKAHTSLIKSKKWRARDAGLEMAYKLKKRYKTDVDVTHKFDHLTDEELEQALVDELERAIELVVE